MKSQRRINPWTINLWMNLSQMMEIANLLLPLVEEKNDALEKEESLRRLRSLRSLESPRSLESLEKLKKPRKEKKRGLNPFFKLMLAAKKAGKASFVYNGHTYKGRKHERLGMIYKKG